jgi:itaconyl-CoA hydratase
MNHPILDRAVQRTKGCPYEDFELGRVYEHHWGRTFSQAENALFTTLTLHFNPTYTNLEYAREMGHRDTPLNPLLVFNTIFGLSVEDLSETSTAFLGVDDLKYHLPVYPGDTLRARSTVKALRASAKNPNVGIATWHTQGFNQRNELVCDFMRSNRFNRRTDLPNKPAGTNK